MQENLKINYLLRRQIYWFVLTLFLSYACQRVDEPTVQRAEPKVTDTSSGDTSNQGLATNQYFGLSISMPSAEAEDNQIRALVFYGSKNGRVPHIYTLSTNADDELKIYLFARHNGRVETPIVWSLFPMTDEAYALGDEGGSGYIVRREEGVLRLFARYSLEDALIEQIRDRIVQGVEYYMGAMLGGRSATGLDASGLLYQLEQEVPLAGGTTANTAPNFRIGERILMGERVTPEKRSIPLLSPITRLTQEMIADKTWLHTTFKPRGVLLNMQLENTSLHPMHLEAMRVQSEDFAFSGTYSLKPEHLIDPVTGAVRDYPPFFSGHSQQDFGARASLRASGDELRFRLKGLGSATIDLPEGTSSDSYISLWAMPLSGLREASVSMSFDYKVPYAEDSYSHTTKTQRISLRPKRGQNFVLEGQSRRSANPIALKEQIPSSVDHIDLARWMQYLPASTPLSRLSLVGTHDTMASDNDKVSSGNKSVRRIWQTQDWTLRQQLDNGVRYLDIRLKHNQDGKFYLYHGIIYLGTEFERDVLDVLHSFLGDNPSETVIMTLKNEGGDGEVFKRELPKTLAQYHRSYPNVLRVDGWSGRTSVGEVRGRVLILSREGYIGLGAWLEGIDDNAVSDPMLMALEYHNETARFADVYKGSTSWNDKYKQIREAINYAMSADHEHNLVFNHLNQAYYNPTWTPRTMSREYNKYAKERLQEHINNSLGYPMRSGFIILDFVNEDNGQALTKMLVDQSLTSNNPHYRQALGRKPPLYNP